MMDEYEYIMYNKRGDVQAEFARGELDGDSTEDITRITTRAQLHSKLLNNLTCIKAVGNRTTDSYDWTDMTNRQVVASAYINAKSRGQWLASYQNVKAEDSFASYQRFLDKREEADADVAVKHAVMHHDARTNNSVHDWIVNGGDH